MFLAGSCSWPGQTIACESNAPGEPTSQLIVIPSGPPKWICEVIPVEGPPPWYMATPGPGPSTPGPGCMSMDGGGKLGLDVHGAWHPAIMTPAIINNTAKHLIGSPLHKAAKSRNHGSRCQGGGGPRARSLRIDGLGPHALPPAPHLCFFQALAQRTFAQDTRLKLIVGAV